LPGEGREEIIETAKECGRLKLDGIKIHPIHVLKNTQLEKIYNEGKFKVMEMDEYIDILIEFLSYLYPETIIQRLTADCDWNYLVAPIWLKEKQKMLKLLEERMKEKNLYQGKYFEKGGL
jgi:radical SAM superfamily enzyme